MFVGAEVQLCFMAIFIAFLFGIMCLMMRVMFTVLCMDELLICSFKFE